MVTNKNWHLCGHTLSDQNSGKHGRLSALVLCYGPLEERGQCRVLCCFIYITAHYKNEAMQGPVWAENTCTAICQIITFYFVCSET